MCLLIFTPCAFNAKSLRKCISRVPRENNFSKFSQILPKHGSCVSIHNTVFDLNPHIFLKKLYGPFLWMWFNCLRATEPLRKESLCFTPKSPETSGAHLIDLRGIKG